MAFPFFAHISISSNGSVLLPPPRVLDNRFTIFSGYISSSSYSSLSLSSGLERLLSTLFSFLGFLAGEEAFFLPLGSSSSALELGFEEGSDFT
jgi:hypothetical protein